MLIGTLGLSHTEWNMRWQVLHTKQRTNVFGGEPVQAQNKAGLMSYSVPALDKRCYRILGTARC